MIMQHNRTPQEAMQVVAQEVVMLVGVVQESTEMVSMIAKTDIIGWLSLTILMVRVPKSCNRRSSLNNMPPTVTSLPMPAAP